MPKTEERADVAKRNGIFRFLANALGSVTGSGAIARRAGLMYGDDRDSYQILGYDTEIEFADFLGKYRREDIAGKIVDAPARATWRKGFRILDATGSQESGFIRAWQDLALRLRVPHHFQRVDRLSGIGRYGVLLIGFNDQGKLESPIERVSGPNDVLFLSAFHEGRTDIVKYVTDKNSPRFGLPEMYRVELTSDVRTPSILGDKTTTKTSALSSLVHWSRLIHVAEDTIEDNVFGRPRLERVFNRLDDLLKVSGGSAEMFWQNVAGLWWLNIGENFDFADADLEDLEEKMFEALHGLRRFVQTQGADLEKFLADSPKPKEVFDVLITLIAGAAEIPQRMLVGSERGELASTQDEANFLGEMETRQRAFAEPVIVRGFIDRLIELNALPAPAEGYVVEWPNLFTLSELQKATAAKDYASALNSFAGATGDPQRIVPEFEFRERFLDLPPEPPEEPVGVAANRLRVHQEPVGPGAEFWRTIHLIADGMVPDLRSSFLAAIEAVKQAVPIAQVEAAIAGADIAGIEALIPTGLFEQQFGTESAELLRQAFVRTAELAAREISGELGIEFAFDSTDSRIQRFIDEHTAEAVRQVTDGTKRAIRSFISTGFAEGQTPRQMANNIRGTIGLTEHQEGIVTRFREELRTAGISGRRLEAMTEEFRLAKINERAIVIARNESIIAANAGQDAMFTQLEESGLATNVFREWIVTPDDRLCPICRPMEGQRRRVGEPFVSPFNGAQTVRPPIHIQCRCAVSLVFDPALPAEAGL